MLWSVLMYFVLALVIAIGSILILVMISARELNRRDEEIMGHAADDAKFKAGPDV